MKLLGKFQGIVFVKVRVSVEHFEMNSKTVETLHNNKNLISPCPEQNSACAMNRTCSQNCTCDYQ